MVAMSIWGNPSIGKLIKTLNSTVLAMSRYATFMHNLPVAYDELQIVRSKYKSFDEIIIQLAEGIDRGLGRRDFIDNLPPKEEIIKRYSEILKEVNSTTELKDKQTAAVATVLLGDELSNRIFNDDLLTLIMIFLRLKQDLVIML